MIKIEDLHKKFGKNKVLTGLDLDIGKGEVLGVLGPNGSGKTTLIKCILGMVIPDKGKIEVNGHSVLKKWRYRKEIDYLPQIATFPKNLKVSELLRMIKDLRGKTEKDKELIARFNIEAFLNKKLGNLSGGTKQKVNLVIALMYDSPLIILDEPTSGLDPVAMLTLKEIIQEKKQAGKTILITSHIMTFVEQMSEGIVFILDGKIYFKGTIDELKKDTQEDDFERAIASLLKVNHA